MRLADEQSRCFHLSGYWFFGRKFERIGSFPSESGGLGFESRPWRFFYRPLHTCHLYFQPISTNSIITSWFRRSQVRILAQLHSYVVLGNLVGRQRYSSRSQSQECHNLTDRGHGNQNEMTWKPISRIWNGGNWKKSWSPQLSFPLQPSAIYIVTVRPPWNFGVTSDFTNFNKVSISSFVGDLAGFSPFASLDFGWLSSLYMRSRISIFSLKFLSLSYESSIRILHRAVSFILCMQKSEKSKCCTNITFELGEKIVQIGGRTGLFPIVK